MPKDVKSRLESKAIVLALAAACGALIFAYGASSIIRGLTPAAIAPAPQTASAPPPAAGGDGGALSTQIVRGHFLFTQECVSCHGGHGQGGIGPDLRRLGISDTQMEMTIKGGVKPEMPAYGSKYGDADIHALTKYIRSLNK